MSLESYDETTDTAAKAAIMQKDVVGKTPPITRVESARRVAVALNQRGTLISPSSQLVREAEDQVVRNLGTWFFTIQSREIGRPPTPIFPAMFEENSRRC